MSELFSKQTIAFLVENRLMNDKAWFEAHREVYREDVIAPFAALVTALTPAMHKIDERFVMVPKVGGSISRVWRDTRFSKDKSLYRDTMWISMIRQKGLMLPEFFFAITPDNFMYGCGYYAAGSAGMNSLREMILSGSEAFQAAFAMYNDQDLFVLEGDMYKRSRHKDAPEALRHWLDRKVISLMRTSDDWDLLYSDRLADTLAEQLTRIAPMYDLLIKAEERAHNLEAASRYT